MYIVFRRASHCVMLIFFIACTNIHANDPVRYFTEPSSVLTQANEEQAFVQWLAAADCHDLRAESLFISQSLAVSDSNLRKWKMKLRYRIVKFRGLYAQNCLEKNRAWLYECISIKRAVDLMRSALAPDCDLLGNVRALRKSLVNRHKRIEQRHDVLCSNYETAS